MNRQVPVSQAGYTIHVVEYFDTNAVHSILFAAAAWDTVSARM